MIKLTYAYVQRNQDFGQAMRRLLTTPSEQKLAYSLKRINDKIQSQRTKIIDEYKETVIKKFAKLDEKGDVVPSPENPSQFVKLEGVTEDDLDKAQETFWNKEFVVARPKLKLSQLANIQLTAMDLTALEPLYEDDSETSDEA